MSVFWRYWMYYMNPSTYWIGGVMAATLSSQSVECAPEEAAYFNPPPGSTCASYASSFVSSAGGYLTNPSATADCGYCAYKDGVEYMAKLHIVPGNKWPFLGVFALFCVSNWLLVYFFIYTVRIRGWSFGMSSLFGGLGKLVDVVKGLDTRRNKKAVDGKGKGEKK